MSLDRSETRADNPPPSEALHRPRVKVVGYDGSCRARDVVEGAARRVVSGDRLIIVHALGSKSEGDSLSVRYRRACDRMLSELDVAVLDGIDFELRVVDEPPARALIEVARDTRAVAIVIGARRDPSPFRQGAIRFELEAGPVPVVVLTDRTERCCQSLPEPVDPITRYGYDSFPASDPPSSWSGSRRSAVGHCPA